MVRANGIAYAVFFLILLIGWRSGCDFRPDLSEPSPPADATVQTGGIPTDDVRPDPPLHGPSVRGSLIIGSFNIQIFGVAKSNDSFAMGYLVDIARRFDLLAIQELRARDQSVVENFVRLINADGSRYSYIVGPRQGTTNSKEQYVYLYDTNKLRQTSQPYVAVDPTGTLQRSPLVASFECVYAQAGTGFTFTVLNLHVDPDVVDAEFAAFEQIMPGVMMNHAAEDDFLLLGDFNASAKKMHGFDWLRNQLPLVRANWATKPRSGRSLDNIVIDSVRTSEYANQSGVLNVTHEYGLSVEQSVRISDHYPVWAVFSTREEASHVAAASGQPLR